MAAGEEGAALAPAPTTWLQGRSGLKAHACTDALGVQGLLMLGRLLYSRGPGGSRLTRQALGEEHSGKGRPLELGHSPPHSPALVSSRDHLGLEPP